MVQQLDLRVEHVFLSPDQVMEDVDTRRVRYACVHMFVVVVEGWKGVAFVW